MLAFKFDKINILNQSYHETPSNFELADLKSEALQFDKNLKTCLNEPITPNNDYNIKNSSTPEKALLSILQENAFWNHHLYNQMYLKKRKLIFWLIGIVFSAIIVYPLIYTNFSQEPFKIILIFLSFGLLYEIIDEMFNYRRASIEMHEIDNEITRIYEKKKNTNSAMSLLVKYHYAKEMCPSIDDDIYKSNKDALNKAWGFRIMNSLNTTLEKVTKELETVKAQWAVTGGANLFLRGCKDKTKDIDIITTENGFDEILKKLGIDKFQRPYEKRESESKKLRSYYTLHKIDGTDIDIMAEPEVLINGEWEPLNWTDKIEKIKLPDTDTEIYTTNIEYEEYTRDKIHAQNIDRLKEICKK